MPIGGTDAPKVSKQEKNGEENAVPVNPSADLLENEALDVNGGFRGLYGQLVAAGQAEIVVSLPW